jgi:hypothetical protein
MPQNLADNSATFPAQTAPLAGESRSVASVATPFQNSADRTAYLKAKLDPILDGSGNVTTAALAASGGAAKIQATNVANGIVALARLSEAGPFTTAATTYSSLVTSGTLTLSLQIGDIVHLQGQAEVYQQDLTPAIHYTQWLVTKPNLSTAAVAQSEVRTKNGALNEFTGLPIGVYYVADAAGTHTFTLQQKSEAASGGATVAVKNLNVVALAVRP